VSAGSGKKAAIFLCLKFGVVELVKESIESRETGEGQINAHHETMN
jgi:hypothetical protein